MVTPAALSPAYIAARHAGQQQQETRIHSKSILQSSSNIVRLLLSHPSSHPAPTKMMRKAVAAVALLALLAVASAQQNADDARQLGESGCNYCEALCKEAVKRNNSYAKLEDFCVKECNKCVDAVQKTTQGKKEDLPAPCKTAYNFKEIPAIISEFQSGKVSASKTGSSCKKL